MGMEFNFNDYIEWCAYTGCIDCDEYMCIERPLKEVKWLDDLMFVDTDRKYFLFDGDVCEKFDDDTGRVLGGEDVADLLDGFYTENEELKKKNKSCENSYNRMRSRWKRIEKDFEKAYEFAIDKGLEADFLKWMGWE